MRSVALTVSEDLKEKYSWKIADKNFMMMIAATAASAVPVSRKDKERSCAFPRIPVKMAVKPIVASSDIHCRKTCAAWYFTLSGDNADNFFWNIRLPVFYVSNS